SVTAPAAGGRACPRSPAGAASRLQRPGTPASLGPDAPGRDAVGGRSHVPGRHARRPGPYPGRDDVMLRHALVRIARTWAVASLGLGLGLAAGTAAAGEPKVGDKAPAFTLPGTDGKTYPLDDFKGKKAVVLAWFPKAFTGGCTKE